MGLGCWWLENRGMGELIYTGGSLLAAAALSLSGSGASASLILALVG
jgi:hypothetical protein